MRMTVTQMFENRDLMSNIALSYYSNLGEDLSEIVFLDDIENLGSNEEIKKYIIDYLNERNKKIMIIPSWIFSKETYHLMYSYYDFEANQNDGIYVMVILNLPIMFVINGEDEYRQFLHKLSQKDISRSNLAIKDMMESENGLIVNYLDHSEHKEFMEKPEVIENIGKSNKENNEENE